MLTYFFKLKYPMLPHCIAIFSSWKLISYQQSPVLLIHLQHQIAYIQGKWYFHAKCVKMLQEK